MTTSGKSDNWKMATRCYLKIAFFPLPIQWVLMVGSRPKAKGQVKGQMCEESTFIANFGNRVTKTHQGNKIVQKNQPYIP